MDLDWIYNPKKSDWATAWVYLALKIMDESDLHANLQNWHGSINNVEPIREVFDVHVEGAGDDGEDVVEEEEDGRQSEQTHVQVGTVLLVLRFQLPKMQLLSFR